MLGITEHPFAGAWAKAPVLRVYLQPLGGCEQDVPARANIKLLSCVAHHHPKCFGPLRWWVLGQKVAFQPSRQRFGATGAGGMLLQQVEMALVTGADP